MKLTSTRKIRRPRSRRGVMSMEYIMILAAIVVPFAIAVVPLVMNMITVYTQRILMAVGSPLG